MAPRRQTAASATKRVTKKKQATKKKRATKAKSNVANEDNVLHMRRSDGVVVWAVPNGYRPNARLAYESDPKARGHLAHMDGQDYMIKLDKNGRAFWAKVNMNTAPKWAVVAEEDRQPATFSRADAAAMLRETFAKKPKRIRRTGKTVFITW